MQLTMLGTGNALATECYNTCFLLSEADEHFLVDGGGGNGLLRQLHQARADWRQIRSVFVTHHHMDYLLGVLWLVRMICQAMSEDCYEGCAAIHAHEELAHRIGQMARMLLPEKDACWIGRRLQLVPLSDGDCVHILGRSVRFFDIRSAKDRQFGFTMALSGGGKLTCLGDEPYREHEQPYAQDSTWLLHEAFCLASQADIFRPYEKHHSTVKEACQTAQLLRAKNLILYHTEDSNLPQRSVLYRQEGCPFFSGNLYIPNDLDIFQL